MEVKDGKRYRSIKSASVTSRNVNSKPKVRWGATSAKTSRNWRVTPADSIPVAPHITHGWGEWCDSEGSEGNEEESYSVLDRFQRKVVFNNTQRYPSTRNVSYSSPLNIKTILRSKPQSQPQGPAYYYRDTNDKQISRGLTAQFPVRRGAPKSLVCNKQSYEWVPDKGVEEEGLEEEVLDIAMFNVDKQKKAKHKRKERMPITGRAGLLALHFDPKQRLDNTKNTNTAQVASLITESVRKKKPPPTPAPSPPAPSPLFDASAINK